MSFGVPAWAANTAELFSAYAPFSWVAAGFLGLLVASLAWAAIFDNETRALISELEKDEAIIKRQAAEIRQLRSELSGRLGQPFGDPAKS